MRKVLVCGGAGYIGSHVVLDLCRAGLTPIIVDNFSNSEISVVKRVSQLCQFPVEFHCMDLADVSSVYELFSTIQPDAVIQLAGLKSVADSVTDPITYYSQNISITLNILKAMSAYGTNKLIFSSSATVYGNPQYLPIDESHPIAPVNPYGNTKYFQEEIILDWVKSQKNDSSAVVLRYFNPVGADPSGEIGERPNGKPANLMPILGEVARGVREKVVVYGDDYSTRDGTCERDYIHVADLAAAHVAALTANLNEAFEVFNVGTGTGITVLEAIKTYSQCLGFDLPFEIGKRRAGDATSSVAANKKILKHLNWKPQYTFKHACHHECLWQRN